MKKFLFACLLALPVVALSDAPACAWGCGFKICLGFNISCTGCCTPCCDTGCGSGCGSGSGYGSYGCDTGCGYGGGYGYDGVCYGNTGYSGYNAGTAYATGYPMTAPAQMAAYQQPMTYPTYNFAPAGNSFQTPAYVYGR